MRRIDAAWLLGLPLAVLGWLSAHAVAYGLLAPGAHERAELLAATGHGYADYLPLLAAACLVAAAGGFAVRARGRRGRAVPGWALGVLPLAGFAVQEYLERGLQNGGIPWGTGIEPVFLVGLVLQIPFALVAALVARALGRLADAVAAQAPRRPRLAPCAALLCPTPAERRPFGALAGGHAGRAPPLRA